MAWCWCNATESKPQNVGGNFTDRPLSKRNNELLKTLMTIFFIILFIPLLVGSWYGIDFLVKKIMKSKYDRKYSVISFAVSIPVLFIIFVYILLSLAFMSGAEFKD